LLIFSTLAISCLTERNQGRPKENPMESARPIINGKSTNHTIWHVNRH